VVPVPVSCRHRLEVVGLSDIQPSAVLASFRSRAIEHPSGSERQEEVHVSSGVSLVAVDCNSTFNGNYVYEYGIEPECGHDGKRTCPIW
jgi:hypothetical protein